MSDASLNFDTSGTSTPNRGVASLSVGAAPSTASSPQGIAGIALGERASSMRSIPSNGIAASRGADKAELPQLEDSQLKSVVARRAARRASDPVPGTKRRRGEGVSNAFPDSRRSPSSSNTL